MLIDSDDLGIRCLLDSNVRVENEMVANVDLFLAAATCNYDDDDAIHVQGLHSRFRRSLRKV